MLKKIDHIGIAVASIEAARAYYENVLGLKLDHVEDVPSQKVKTAFFDVGGVWLELLEPTAPDSPIAKFLEKNPHGGMHHMAFLSDEVGAELKSVAAKGVRLIDENPRGGAGKMDIGFLHPKGTQGVLTEFCSPQK
ncbi:MAG TPA: methylmalonyl-CoA epimerase [Fibrobacteraceae bacterium]|nr:methylmalonyl-CoA epimerase [Fibrobacteraceae bacterium]